MRTTGRALTACLAAMVLAAGAARAQETAATNAPSTNETPEVEKRPYTKPSIAGDEERVLPVGRILLSVAYPGLGQTVYGQRRGYVMLAVGSVALLNAGIFEILTADAYEDYAALGPAEYVSTYDDRWDDVQQNRLVRNIFLAAAGGIWTWSLIDSLVPYRPATRAGKEATALVEPALRVERDAVSVALRGRF